MLGQVHPLGFICIQNVSHLIKVSFRPVHVDLDMNVNLLTTGLAPFGSLPTDLV